jgi:GNAT superfamily N-acetyltransferase
MTFSHWLLVYKNRVQVMMKDILIKTAQDLSEIDLRLVARIDSDIPALYDKTHPPVTPEIIEDRYRYLKDNLHQGLFQVAFHQEKLIGFHILQPRGFKTLIVTTLWVDPNYRKRGLGKKMKEDGVEWAKKQGMIYISTTVSKYNSRMLEINQKNGFEVTSYQMRLKL